MRRFRMFSSRLEGKERLIYGAVTLVFVGTFFALQWPVYPWFSRIRPLVLGMPLSLFYLLVLLGICFVSLLGLYLWEDRRGKLE